MKKSILIFILSFYCYSISTSQVIENKQSEKRYTYCELGGVFNSSHTEVEVWINYGEKVTKDTKPVIFNTMIDAMNSMASKGWELVSVYTVPVASHYVCYYILRKEVKTIETTK